MLKKFSLRNRMLLSIGSVALIAFAITITVITHQAAQLIQAEALSRVEEMGYRYSNAVKADLALAMDAARTTAQLFEGMKKNAAVPDRSVLNDMLRQLLERNPGFLGTWTCWEPDRLDGRDAAFSGKPGHDDTGRFIPYWYRKGRKTALAPLEGYDTPGTGDYYLLSLTKGKEVILDPYPYEIEGEEVLLTSLVVPIRYQGRVVGVAGVDISLSAFNEMVSQVKPYNTGNAALISNGCTYVAHADPTRSGKDIGQTPEWKKIKAAVRSGACILINDFSIHLKTDVERIIVPIQVGATGTPWAFLINVPMDKVMAGVKHILYLSILIGVGSLLVLMLVVFFYCKGNCRSHGPNYFGVAGWGFPGGLSFGTTLFLQSIPCRGDLGTGRFH